MEKSKTKKGKKKRIRKLCEKNRKVKKLTEKTQQNKSLKRRIENQSYKSKVRSKDQRPTLWTNTMNQGPIPEPIQTLKTKVQNEGPRRSQHYRSKTRNVDPVQYYGQGMRTRDQSED